MVKIVICGAGIAGLSTYLLLQKHLNESSASSSHEIKIYEAYDIRKPSSKNNDAATGRSKTPTAPSQDISADEPVPTPQTIGGGIGISKNGLNVLSRMEPSDNKSSPTHASGEHDETSGTGVNSGLIKEMARRGHPIERWEISTARGWTIVDVNLISRHLRDPGNTTSSSDSGAPSIRRRSSIAKKDCYMYHSVMIARHACWEILRDRVLDHSPDVVVKKRIVGVFIGDAATPNIIKFEDGNEELADLVIGADGLRSTVRKAMFETDNINAQEADVHKSGHVNQGWAQAVLRWLGLSSNPGEKGNSTGCDYITPHYEGLVGVGGFVPSSLLESTGHKPGTMSIVFGPNGFFGYGYLTSTDYTSPESQGTDAASDDIKDINTRPSLIPGTSQPGAVAGWWSTFSSPTPYPYAAATGIPSSGKSNKPTEFNKPLAVKSLVARHKMWKNPTISAIVNYVESSSPTAASTSALTPPPPPPAPTHSKKEGDLTPDRALEASYPTWTTPELPHWTLRGRAVLVGDAAHALQPSSGQGACQALEDAEALALLLKHHLDSNNDSVRRGSASAFSVSPEHTSTAAAATASATTPATATALTTALAQYEALRKPRVHAIYTRSQKMSRMKGDMGLLMEWTMYLIIYIMTWFRDDYNEAIFEYDLPSEVEKVIKDAEEQASGS